MAKTLAKILYALGFEPHYSTGVDGGITSGYGKMDSNGYFQFPLD